MRQIVEIDSRLDLLHGDGGLPAEMPVDRHILRAIRARRRQLRATDQGTLSRSSQFNLRMSEVLQDFRSNPQTYTSIRIDVETGLLSEEVRDAVFLDLHLTDHPGARIHAVSVSTELTSEFQGFFLADIVHLHDFGEECLLHVSLYFRASDGIAHWSTLILAPSTRGAARLPDAWQIANVDDSAKEDGPASQIAYAGSKGPRIGVVIFNLWNHSGALDWSGQST